MPPWKGVTERKNRSDPYLESSPGNNCDQSNKIELKYRTGICVFNRLKRLGEVRKKYKHTFVTIYIPFYLQNFNSCRIMQVNYKIGVLILTCLITYSELSFNSGINVYIIVALLATSAVARKSGLNKNHTHDRTHALYSSFYELRHQVIL